MDIVTEQQPFPMLNDVRRFFASRLLQCRNGAGGQVDEADQFVAVEKHPGAPGLAGDHVFNMLGEWVVVILERYQGVASRLREHAERAGQVASDFCGPLESSGFGRDSDDGRIERLGDFSSAALVSSGMFTKNGFPSSPVTALMMLSCQLSSRFRSVTALTMLACQFSWTGCQSTWNNPSSLACNSDNAPTIRSRGLAPRFAAGA